MPSTSAALCLRALVLCTIHTAITAIAVVPVDGFLTGKSASRSLENARRTEFRLDEIIPLKVPAQIRGEISSARIDARLVAALQACCLESPAALCHHSVDNFDASMSSSVPFWFLLGISPCSSHQYSGP